MSTSRTLLVGYYGKGNFGDDVLLKVTHGIVTHRCRDSSISVIVDGDVGGYVSHLCPGVTPLAPARHGNFDRIIHGGGGVFFDFKPNGFFQRAYEHVIRSVGLARFVNAEKAVRARVGKTSTSATIRVGIGMGVGTYTRGSPRWRASLPIIADFAALWVRDAQSHINLKQFGSLVRGQVIAGSDLAFLTHYWMPESLPTRTPSARPRLGIILRDWAQDKGGTPLALLKETLAQLAQEYDITGFIFDQHTDPQMHALFSAYSRQVWQPEHMSIAAFSSQLAMQDVLLTSRAHGAICGACLGVASVIIAIEPKLQEVAAMLPQAAHVVEPLQPQTWAAALRNARMIQPEIIADDVAKNRASSEAALVAMQRYFA